MSQSSLTFPQSDGPLVSVLLPTRGRPDCLLNAVTSLHTNSVHPDKIEYLFRVDADDLETVTCCSHMIESLPQATMVVEQRGPGYVNIHLWHDRLCRLARGDWLLIFNDDALMVTPRWDEVIENIPVKIFPCPDVALLFFSSKDRPGCNEMFILRRKAWEILGCFSLSTHADNWLNRVFGKVNSSLTLPSIVVDHYSHLMKDQTRKDSVAAYDNGNLARATLESPQAQRGIEMSSQKLQDYIDIYQAGTKND